MEKKYYFRGLGLGIIVTAIIMGIALSGGGKRREMTDDEVIARAKELGMTENSRLLTPSEEETDEQNNGQDIEEAAEEQKESVKEPVKLDVAVAEPKPNPSASEQTEEESSEEEAEAPVDTNTKPADTIAKPSDTKSDTNEMTKPDEDAKPEETVKPADTKPADTKSVTIVSGDGSYTVARKLAEAGVVSSASAYDNYLCQNGYDKRLRTGTFQIPAGASDEQIAKIVTSQP